MGSNNRPQENYYICVLPSHRVLLWGTQKIIEEIWNDPKRLDTLRVNRGLPASAELFYDKKDPGDKLP